ncbi:MAG: ABC transporter substrate-binding protein [Jeotgalicoccus sp.]
MLQKKSVFLYVLIIATCLFTTACVNSTSNINEENRDNGVIVHELGETSVPEKPERVVTLELGITETSAALGNIPVGVADDDKPERIAQNTYEKIEGYESVGARAEPSLEKIRYLKPDLIIADVDRHKDIYKELSEIAPTVAVKIDTADYNEVMETTETIGKALGKEDQVQKLIDSHKEKVVQFQEKVKGFEGKWLNMAYTANGTFEAQESSYFMPSFLESVGIEYALQSDGKSSEEMNMERLVSLNPDLIILSTQPDEANKNDEISSQSLWETLPAVKKGNVYEMDHNDLSRRRSLMVLDEKMEELEEYIDASK